MWSLMATIIKIMVMVMMMMSSGNHDGGTGEYLLSLSIIKGIKVCKTMIKMMMVQR